MRDIIHFLAQSLRRAPQNLREYPQNRSQKPKEKWQNLPQSKFLKSLDISVANVVINNLVPAFDDETWELADTNKAVALLKLERDNQQPYLSHYGAVTNSLGIKLCGVPKFPFEPKADRLVDFGRVVCPNLDLTPRHIISKQSKDLNFAKSQY